ncbi:MAG: hypothetical protein Q8O88_01645 [bacterium]|nr:hypothetical protein [bacterium]
MNKVILKKSKKTTPNKKSLTQYMGEVKFWTQIALEQQAIIHAKNRT